MTKGNVAVVAAIAMFGVAGGAHAQVAYNTTLASPGFYNGSGNPSNNFTTDTETLSNGLATGTIELGLRARFRGGPNVTPNLNVYSLPVGTGVTGYALWNYDWSINLDGSGYHLTDLLSTANGGTGLLHATLTVKDVGTSTTVSIDPVIHWGDSATWDGTTKYQNGSGYYDKTANVLKLASAATMIGEQNSENLSFGDSPLAGDFNPHADDSYLFTLSVTDTTNQSQVASVTMQVDTPEPASMALLGAGLAGLGVIRRRRRR